MDTLATENVRYHNLPAQVETQTTKEQFISNGSRSEQLRKGLVRTTRDELDPCQLGHTHAELELRDGEADNERRRGGGRARLYNRDRVDGVDTPKQHLVGPRARRKGTVAPPEADEQGIVRDGHAREACIRDTLWGQRDRGIQDREHERVGVAGRGRGVVVRLDGCGRNWALQDRPVDGEVALHEGFLEQRGKIEAVRAARVGAVVEQGYPFVFAGPGLREEVAQKALGCAADLLRRFGEAEDGGREPPRRGRSSLCAGIRMPLRKCCPRG